MVVLPLPEGPEKTHARPPIDDGGRVEQDPTLLHEEEAAQEPEQVGIQRRSGTGTEIDPAASQVAVRARRMACEREATSAHVADGRGVRPGR